MKKSAEKLAPEQGKEGKAIHGWCRGHFKGNQIQ